MNKLAIVLIASFALGACSVVGVRDGYEQPSYRVVETIGEEVEIRRYAPRLAAEATVETDDSDRAAGKAFRLLFDYITGDNAPNSEIAMTSPVSVAGEGDKIAMTAPVEAAASGGRMTMRFFLPASFDEASVPRPTNGQVSIVTLPEQTVAALRYAGSRDAQAAEAKKAALRGMLASSDWRPAGEAVSYYYDPPWTLPWLRRNEAIVPVARN